MTLLYSTQQARWDSCSCQFLLLQAHIANACEEVRVDTCYSLHVLLHLCPPEESCPRFFGWREDVWLVRSFTELGFQINILKSQEKKKTRGHRVAQVDTVHTVGFHHSRRSSIFYNELQANLPIFTPDRSIVFIIMYSDNPSLCSRERYYLYLPRLFNIWTFSKKIVINKRLSMPLLEETQKHKRPTENNLPIVYTPEYYSWSTISMVNP